MDKAVHEPLDIHFDFSSQSEPVQALVDPDIGKDLLSNGQSLRIDSPSLFGFDFLYHLFLKINTFSAYRDRQVFTFGVCSIKAQRSLRTIPAIFFSSHVFSVNIPMINASFGLQL